MSSHEEWPSVRARIAAAAGSFPAYLKLAPRADLERLIHDEPHRRNVFACFEGTRGDRARDLYDEIARRYYVTFWPDRPAEGEAA